jgi:hypothetical protein
MQKRGKRKERGEERGSGNVIPLHAGRESGVAHETRAERAPADSDDNDNAGGRSVERQVERRGESQDAPEQSSLRKRADEVRGATGATGGSASPSSDDAGKAEQAPQPAPQPASAAEIHPEDDQSDVHDFFAKTPKSIAPSGEPWHDFDHEPAHAPTHHGAMYWTAGIGGAGLLLIGAFLLYNKVLMPTPEELVGTAHIALPTPDMVKPTPTTTPVSDESDTRGNDPAQVPAAVTPASADAPVAAAPLGEQPAAPVTGAEPVPATPAAPAAPAAPATAIPAAAAQPQSTPTGDYEQLLADARKLGFRKPAEAPYLKAIEANPAGVEAISGLSMLYLNQGKNQQAKERAEQALALSQTNDEAWIVLGAAESALGKPRSAREAYTQCAGLPSGKYVAECKRLLR